MPAPQPTPAVEVTVEKRAGANGPFIPCAEGPVVAYTNADGNLVTAQCCCGPADTGGRHYEELGWDEWIENTPDATEEVPEPPVTWAETPEWKMGRRGTPNVWKALENPVARRARLLFVQQQIAAALLENDGDLAAGGYVLG